MNILIRKINKTDNGEIDDIMKIWLNENINAHSFIPRDYWEMNYDYVKSILPNAEIYVYTENDEILGFIGINGSYIEGIFIKSECQHKGIGVSLLNKVKQNKSELTLSVYEKNIKALNFYLKNGFEIIAKSLDELTNETEFTMMWKEN